MEGFLGSDYKKVVASELDISSSYVWQLFCRKGLSDRKLRMVNSQQTMKNSDSLASILK